MQDLYKGFLQDRMLSFDTFDHRNESDQHNDTKQTDESAPNDLLPYKAHTHTYAKHQSGNNGIYDTEYISSIHLR